MKNIFLISAIIIGWPVLTQGAVAVSAPDIANQTDCEALSGNWNTCPPNDCQQSAKYQVGNLDCPQVCGAPICQGLLTVEPIDLSDIHNESIGHKSLSFDDNLPEGQKQPELPIQILLPSPDSSNEMQDKSVIQDQPSQEADIFNFRDFLPAVFVFILGIILIFLGVVLLKKKTYYKL